MIPWTLTIKGYCEQLFDQNFIRLNGPFFEWYNQDIYKTKRICWQNRLLQNIDKWKWATSLNRHFSKGDTQMREKWSVTAVISKQAITPHELPHTSQDHMLTKTENQMYLWKSREMELSFTPGRNENMAVTVWQVLKSPTKSGRVECDSNSNTWKVKTEGSHRFKAYRSYLARLCFETPHLWMYLRCSLPSCAQGPGIDPQHHTAHTTLSRSPRNYMTQQSTS